MSAVVPRRASFDDLRVGMVVSCVRGDDGRVDGGTVARWWPTIRRWEVWQVPGDDETGFYVYESDAPFTILRDAPAAPVTVRREDYDTLRAAVASWAGVEANAHARDILGAARALIDNADTGADQ